MSDIYELTMRSPLEHRSLLVLHMTWTMAASPISSSSFFSFPGAVPFSLQGLILLFAGGSSIAVAVSGRFLLFLTLPPSGTSSIGDL